MKIAELVLVADRVHKSLQEEHEAKGKTASTQVINPHNHLQVLLQHNGFSNPDTDAAGFWQLVHERLAAGDMDFTKANGKKGEWSKKTQSMALGSLALIAKDATVAADVEAALGGSGGLAALNDAMEARRLALLQEYVADPKAGGPAAAPKTSGPAAAPAAAKGGKAQGKAAAAAPVAHPQQKRGGVPDKARAAPLPAGPAQGDISDSESTVDQLRAALEQERARTEKLCALLRVVLREHCGDAISAAVLELLP